MSKDAKFILVIVAIFLAVSFSVAHSVANSKSDFDKILGENAELAESNRANQKEIMRLAGQLDKLSKQIEGVYDLWGPDRWRMKKERVR